MRCPYCGKQMTQNEGETFEEFRMRWESDSCPESPWNKDE